MKWTEGTIARLVGTQTLARRCLLLVDRCTWTGHECDVLAVTRDLRIIDVEVKVTRADLKADAAKDKWWLRGPWRWDQPRPEPTPRTWPPKVWKHYFAMPAAIWTDELLDALPSAASGVLLLDDAGLRVRCARRATPNKDATRLEPRQVIDIARLANLRMWDAYERADQARAEARRWRERAQGEPA